MKGEWSCYINGQFNGGLMVKGVGSIMVMLRRWPV